MLAFFALTDGTTNLLAIAVEYLCRVRFVEAKVPSTSRVPCTGPSSFCRRSTACASAQTRGIQRVWPRGRLGGAGATRKGGRESYSAVAVAVARTTSIVPVAVVEGGLFDITRPLSTESVPAP